MIPQIEPLVSEKDAKAVYDYLVAGGWVTEFGVTKKFEEELASFLGVTHAVVCTSGTAALFIAVSALEIPFSNIAVPNFTMIAAPNAVRLAQCNPVLTDICSETLCIDLNNIGNPIDFAGRREKIRAIIYTPINGRSGNMDEVVSFCSDNKIYLIEDACQAFGSKFGDQYLGTFGDIGVFSLTPHKLITTGQGGILVTNNSDLYAKIVKIKDFGRVSAGVDIHDSMGYNFKFTDMQASLGISQLSTVAERVSKKKQILEWYNEHLGYGEILPFKDGNVPWFIDLLLKDKGTRDALLEYLKDAGIGCRVFYPPISSQEVYAGFSGGPVSEELAYRGLWLPSSLSLDEETIKIVCEEINSFGGQHG